MKTEYPPIDVMRLYKELRPTNTKPPYALDDIVKKHLKNANRKKK